MKYIPRIEYGPTFSLIQLFTLPQKLWEPQEGVDYGDEDESAAGIPVVYTVRYGYGVRVVIRFTDDERLDVMAMIEHILKNKDEAIHYRFDQDDIATEYAVYVDEPAAGTRVRPERDPKDASVWTLALLLRSSTGARIHVPLAIGPDA